MEWLNFNFPSPLAEDGQSIIDGGGDADSLAKNADLWPYLQKLALRGHVTTLANMLERVAPSQELSAAASRWARELAKTSREMPLGSDEETTGSFNARWRQWNGELQNMATAIGSLLDVSDTQSGDAALSSLYTIVDIMRGDADAGSAAGETWQDVLGAILLYSEPTAQADRLPGLAHIVLEQFQTGDSTLLDRALVALLNHDLPEFLVYCNQIDSWLSAHLADMMEHINILEICRRVFAVDPREHYLLALGELYLTHENLWRVSMDYFGLCRTAAGTAVMEEYIVRMPLESDRKAQQVLRVCDLYGLKNARERIHRQLGRQKWQRGRLGAAIGHFAHVNDRNSISQICDQLWAEYLDSGKLTYGPIIDGVMAAGLKHDRLQFLTQYRDFHESYKTGEYTSAGKLLLSILLNETAPAHAVPDLLIDTIPLLEGDKLVFSSDDTFELMRCAESLVQSPFATAAKPSANSAADKGNVGRDELSIFNVACARNLARSFVMQ
ncbi:Nucleoporin nup85 [Coemansia sp. RSA 2610]|nr:Nucleoporin nup85 [Coemansia sp. RSA 2610]